MKKILIVLGLLFSLGAAVFADTATDTATATNTATPTVTRTATNTGTATNTPTVTQTPTATYAVIIGAAISPLVAARNQKIVYTLTTTLYTKATDEYVSFVPALPLYWHFSSAQPAPIFFSPTLYSWTFKGVTPTVQKIIKITGYSNATGCAGVQPVAYVNIKSLKAGFGSTATPIAKIWTNSTCTKTATQTVTQTITQTLTPAATATNTYTPTPIGAAIIVDVPASTLNSKVGYYVTGGTVMKIISQGTDLTGTARTVVLWDGLGNTVFSQSYPIGASIPATIFQGWSWNWGPVIYFGKPFNTTLTAGALNSDLEITYFRK